MFILPYVSDIGKLFSKYSHTILQLPHKQNPPVLLHSLSTVTQWHQPCFPLCKCHLPEESGSISSVPALPMQKLPPGFSAARRDQAHFSQSPFFFSCGYGCRSDDTQESKKAKKRLLYPTRISETPRAVPVFRVLHWFLIKINISRIFF